MNFLAVRADRLERDNKKLRSVLEQIRKEVRHAPKNMNEAYLRNNWIDEKVYIALKRNP